MMAGLDGKEKSRPNQGFEAQTNQPAASHYTDWPIPADNNTDRTESWGRRIVGLL